MTGSGTPSAIASSEWKDNWPVPVIAMMGMSGTMMVSLSSGVLLSEVTAEFHWTRAQYFSGLSLHMLLGLVFAPAVGWVIQKWGVRNVALTGILIFIGSSACLSLANGSIAQWRLLCVLQGFLAAFTGPVVWISAVVPRFNLSRGTAIAVAQAGLGLSSVIWPLLTTVLLQHLGWRMTLVALPWLWALLLWPLVFLNFDRNTAPRARKAPISEKAATAPLRKGDFLNRTFLCLTLSGALFAMMSFGVNVNLVPMLRSTGLSPERAAGIASVAGLIGIAGRIGFGYLLDRFPTRWVGCAIFLLPALASLLFLSAGDRFLPSLITVIFFGVAAGGEADLVAYVASRRLSPEHFPALYAIVLGIFGAMAGLGPFVSGVLYDIHGSYTLFLMVVVVLVTIANGIFLMIPDERGRLPDTDLPAVEGAKA